MKRPKTHAQLYHTSPLPMDASLAGNSQTDFFFKNTWATKETKYISQMTYRTTQFDQHGNHTSPLIQEFIYTPTFINKQLGPWEQLAGLFSDNTKWFRFSNLELKDHSRSSISSRNVVSEYLFWPNTKHTTFNVAFYSPLGAVATIGGIAGALAGLFEFLVGLFKNPDFLDTRLRDKV